MEISDFPTQQMIYLCHLWRDMFGSPVMTVMTTLDLVAPGESCMHPLATLVSTFMA